MEEIIDKLETIAFDIEFDVRQEWNDNKHFESIQLGKLEMAIALLKSIGDNRNT